MQKYENEERLPFILCVKTIHLCFLPFAKMFLYLFSKSCFLCLYYMRWTIFQPKKPKRRKKKRKKMLNNFKVQYHVLCSATNTWLFCVFHCLNQLFFRVHSTHRTREDHRLPLFNGVSHHVHDIRSKRSRRRRWWKRIKRRRESNGQNKLYAWCVGIVFKNKILSIQKVVSRLFLCRYVRCDAVM